MHLVSCHRDAIRQEERERGRGGASLKDNGNYRHHHDVMLYSTSRRVSGRIVSMSQIVACDIFGSTHLPTILQNDMVLFK